MVTKDWTEEGGTMIQKRLVSGTVKIRQGEGFLTVLPQEDDYREQ